MAVKQSPTLLNFTLADDAVHALTDLLAALGADNPLVQDSGKHYVSELSIASDGSNGVKTLKVGNSNLSATFYGVQLLAGQEKTWGRGDVFWPIDLGKLYLKASAASTIVNISMLRL